jgi:hypothetical protein
MACILLYILHLDRPPLKYLDAGGENISIQAGMKKKIYLTIG